MKKFSILLIDDDPIITAGTGGDLEENGYAVTTTDSGEKAIEWLKKISFDLIITDLAMSPMNGIEVVKKAKEINPEMMVIILTGFGDMDSVIEAMRFDADDFILKPCDPGEMNLRLSRCFEKLEIKRKITLYEHILPVCPMCKKIRIDSGKVKGVAKWVSMEKYIHDKAKVNVRSSYCPACAEEFKKLGIDIGVDPGNICDF